VIEHDGKYRVIYADPNWSYANFGAKDHGAAKAHYAGSTVEDICSVPVAKWTHPQGSLLFLWGTWPKLPEALKVMNAWGFDYITGLPWVKISPSSGNIRTGIGFWFQSTSEVLFVGRRGKAKAPKRGEDPVLGLLCGSERQFYAPVKEHSAKPLSLQDWIVAKFPGPYLELYARNKIHNWTSWGYDTGFELGPWGVRSLVAPHTTAVGILDGSSMKGCQHPSVVLYLDGGWECQDCGSVGK
jgi:N6-adenosine-specific RNA methylase IME4